MTTTKNYAAFLSQDDIRELHIRVAENRNSEIPLRDLIPPQLYERFRMEI